MQVGTYDEANQRIVPAAGLPPQLLDPSIYASKSFWDPVHEQRVWSGWLGEQWLVQSPGGKGRQCANLTVCSTHVLPRKMVWDDALRRMRTPPVPQLAALRVPADPALAHLVVPSLPLDVPTDGIVQPLTGIAGMQLELYATFARPAAGTTVSFGLATRLGVGQRTDCRVTIDGASGNASLGFCVNNTSPTATVTTPTRKGKVNDVALPLVATDTNITLRCFVDHSVIEAYSMDGRAAISARTYPSDEAVGVGIFAIATPAVETKAKAETLAVDGPSRNIATVTLLAFEAYEMDTIWVDKL